MKYKIFIFPFAIVFLFSCKSVPKNIGYFEDLKEKTISEIQLSALSEEPKILPSNILEIFVSSSNIVDNSILEQFNLLPLTAPDLSMSKSAMQFISYMVDKNGEITFPVLGKIKVQDLTVLELQDLLTSRLKQYISEPIVTVLLQNNRIKIFGEVKTPGIYDIKNENRYSILDAIANAGDITIYGDKKRVKLLRENNGKMESIIMDLTSSDIFSSPYFYLKQNDVIVVDPNKTRKKDSLYGSSDSYKLNVISTVIGTVSLIASTVITIVSLKR